MSARDSVFRGQRLVREIKARLLPLVRHPLTMHTRAVRLFRKEWDVIWRWKSAARIEGFEFAGDRVSFEGISLLRDSSEPRYRRWPGDRHLQTDIEKP